MPVLIITDTDTATSMADTDTTASLSMADMAITDWKVSWLGFYECRFFTLSH